jgi:hypothetical protein
VILIIIGVIAVIYLNNIGIPFAVFYNSLFVIFGLALVITPFYILSRNRSNQAENNTIDWNERIRELELLSKNASANDKHDVKEFIQLAKHYTDSGHNNPNTSTQIPNGLGGIITAMVILGLVFIITGAVNIYGVF